jgi:hypothetical protein
MATVKEFTFIEDREEKDMRKRICISLLALSFLASMKVVLTAGL